MLMPRNHPSVIFNAASYFTDFYYSIMFKEIRTADANKSKYFQFAGKISGVLIF